jgi:drug/metabolite transporter (DMT)-like permease
MPRFLPSLTAALCWGAMFPITAPALDRIDPFHLTSVRYLVASALFLAILAATEGRRALRFEGRLLELTAFGVAGFAGFNLLTFVALEHTRPQDAALIVATSPVLMVLLLWVLGMARPRGLQLALTAAAFVGVALVISRGELSNLGGSSGAWELVVLGGVLAWTIYTLGARRFPGLSPLRYTALTAVPGTLGIVLVTAIVQLAGGIGGPGADDYAAEWWRLLYVILAGAVVAVLAWNLGVKKLGPANGSLFINLVPVVTFAIAIGQGYRPGATELAGAALTIAALVGANLAGRRAARAALPAKQPTLSASRA